MIPDFTLTRSIEIRVTRFAGEVSKEEKRPELMPFLMMARDHGAISAVSAAGHLLGASEGRRPIAKRLLEQLERSGALEAQGNREWKLTEAGQEALEKEAVFIGETGSWEIWHTSDQLLPHGLIQLQAYAEPKAFEEIRRDAPKRNAGRPHLTLDVLKGLPLKPIMDGARRRIDALPDKVEILENKSGTLSWEVAKGRLTFTVDEKSFDLPAPRLSHAAAFEELLINKGMIADWDTERQMLRSGFADLSEADRRRMCVDINFTDPVRLCDYGNFDQTTVSGIEINARTRPDAKAWAEWRLQDGINEIACSRRFAEWREQAAAPFSAFMPLNLPDRADLAARTRPTETGSPRSAVNWNLTAAEDWNL